MNAHLPPSLSVSALRTAAPRLAFAALAVGFAGAHAAGFSIGAGAGVDRGRVDCVASFPCDRSSTHAKVFVGYRLTDNVELQAVYFDAGHFDGGDTAPGTPVPPVVDGTVRAAEVVAPVAFEFGGRFKVSGFGVTAGYRWDLAPAWSLTARAGVASVRTRFDYANPDWGTAAKTTTQPLLGLGVAYAVTPALRLGIDYDLTRFKVHTTNGPLQMLGLTAQYAF
jgi:OOP family OmpA-OmpF porin